MPRRRSATLLVHWVGVAFIGLQNMGKMAAGAVGAAVEAGASAVEASKDDAGFSTEWFCPTRLSRRWRRWWEF